MGIFFVTKVNCTSTNIDSSCDDEQVIELTEYRANLYDYLKHRMMAIAPNVTALVGELVGARLISHAGMTCRCLCSCILVGEMRIKLQTPNSCPILGQAELNKVKLFDQPDPIFSCANTVGDCGVRVLPETLKNRCFSSTSY